MGGRNDIYAVTRTTTPTRRLLGMDICCTGTESYAVVQAEHDKRWCSYITRDQDGPRDKSSKKGKRTSKTRSGVCGYTVDAGYHSVGTEKKTMLHA